MKKSGGGLVVGEDGEGVVTEDRGGWWRWGKRARIEGGEWGGRGNWRLRFGHALFAALSYGDLSFLIDCGAGLWVRFSKGKAVRCILQANTL